MKNKYKYIIIGAGPCGLGAGYFFTKNNEDSFLIIEKESHVGGLATSFKDQAGFTWDIGGHVLFSHYEYFDKALLEAIPKEDWLHHQRHASVYIDKRFVDYPFQNNIHQLDPDKAQQCLNDLEEVSKIPTNNSSFRTWIESNFGKTISDIFMLPYNFKVWGHPAEMMSSNWVGERVAVIDLKKIKNNFATGMPDTNWGPNNKFSFPKHGGTGAIWKGFEKIIPQHNILKNAQIKQINYHDKKIILSDGTEISYQVLLNTIPIKVLSTLLQPQIESISKDAYNLSTNVSHIIGFGFKGTLPDHLQDKCWIYFPENNTPFYRVTVLSKYSPNNTPDSNHWSLMCEVTESAFKEVNLSTIIEESLAGLQQTILSNINTECVDQWYYSTNPGYPVPSFDRDDLMRSIHQALKPFQIFSRGRFGGHKYEVSNMDHSFMQGVEWAQWMKDGIVEKTYKE